MLDASICNSLSCQMVSTKFFVLLSPVYRCSPKACIAMGFGYLKTDPSTCPDNLQLCFCAWCPTHKNHLYLNALFNASGFHNTACQFIEPKLSGAQMIHAHNRKEVIAYIQQYLLQRKFQKSDKSFAAWVVYLKPIKKYWNNQLAFSIAYSKCMRSSSVRPASVSLYSIIKLLRPSPIIMRK